MKFLLIKDDVGIYHHVKVTPVEWEQSHVAGGWMADLFGTNSEYHNYTEKELDEGNFDNDTFKSLHSVDRFETWHNEFAILKAQGYWEKRRQIAKENGSFY